MRSNYQERKENKLKAFERLAEKNEQLSHDLYLQSKKMSDCIPMGQPILVGHHSEKADRKFRDRIWNKLGQSVEAERKATYYKERAKTLLNNTAISTDNPNALELLKEKLQDLEDLQVLYKSINKIVFNKKVTEAEKIELLNQIGIDESMALEYMGNNRFNKWGIERFTLTNNNVKINTTKKRILFVESVASLPYSEEIINGVKFVISPEDNRVQLFFNGKPSDGTRQKLKSKGFRWSPSIGAWMRQVSNGAIYDSKQILKDLV